LDFAICFAMPKLKHYENIHILLWLLKDTCWMMHWKILGVTMIVPTVAVALIIAIHYYHEKKDEFWVNLAVLFWITGNSYWMLCEFFNREDIKNYAGIPFIMGMLAVAYYYKKNYFSK
jgi:Na+/citrate or Na+/malate symporter